MIIPASSSLSFFNLTKMYVHSWFSLMLPEDKAKMQASSWRFILKARWPWDTVIAEEMPVKTSLVSHAAKTSLLRGTAVYIYAKLERNIVSAIASVTAKAEKIGLTRKHVPDRLMWREIGSRNSQHDSQSKFAELLFFMSFLFVKRWLLPTLESIFFFFCSGPDDVPTRSRRSHFRLKFVLVSFELRQRPAFP